MKWLLPTLIAASLLWSAPIDTNLYEGTEREAYYQQLQKQIETEAASGLRPEATIREERLYLERVRSAAAQTPQIERYDLKPFSDPAITSETYYSAINAAARLHWREEQRSQMRTGIDAKLAFLKHAIENIVEDEKPQLLSYQLQYAYYRLQQKNLEAKSALVQRHEKEIMAALVEKLPLLQCDTAGTLEQGVLRSDKAIGQSFQQKVALQIELEKFAIEESAKMEQVRRKIEEAEAQYQQALAAKGALLVQRSLCMLKQKENKAFFRLLSEAETLGADLSGEEKPLYSQQLDILREIARKQFGTAKLFLGATQHEGKEMLTTLKDSFATPLFVFNEQPITFVSLLKAVAIIILGFFLGMLYKRWIARISRRWPDMSQMSVRLASNIGYYLIMAVALINAVSSIGIDMTSLSLIAGALSIGIGFGLQTVVSNLIAGIILMFERTIRIGDTIEISDLLRGRVTDMRIRSTTIKTFDNIDIVVPNSSFIQNNVVNWTLEDPTRRIHIPFSVAYGTEVEKVKKTVLDELAQSDLTYINNDSEKHPEVWMVAMGSSSVDFELIVWVEWASRLRPNSLRSDFMILIYNALYKHGIQIPFPQLDLYVKQMPADTIKQ